MHPVFYRCFMITDGTLCNFTFMVRKKQVHTAAMNIKLCAQVFCGHGRAFNMPAGETHSPRAFPAHDVFRCGRFPQGKICKISFFFLPVQLTGCLQQIINDPSAKLAVIMRGRIFFYIKVNRSIYLITISFTDNFFNHIYLLYNMAGSGWLYAWVYAIKFSESPMKKVGIFLHQFHGFQFFKQCFFAYFIFCFTAFFFKMPGISYVAYIPHFIPFVHKVAKYHIKRNIRAGMAQMAFTTYCRAANIHACMAWCNGFKFLFLPCI